MKRGRIAHCRPRRGWLKAALLLLLAAPAPAQPPPAATPDTLPAALRADLAAGRAADAVRRVQDALRRRPDDPAVRRAFVDLHLTLAEAWLAERRYDDVDTALAAILAVESAQPDALRLRDRLTAARRAAAEQAAEIDRLLRLELFDAALQHIREIETLRPDLRVTLTERRRSAWRGAADDAYLARNFAEAFALYEALLADDPAAPADVHARWAVSLALALAETDFREPLDPNAAGRLLARAIDVLRRCDEPIVGQTLGGLLAERADQTLEAGRLYAEAVGAAWELPPMDQRRAAVARLRARAVARVRAIYADLPVARRDGFWSIALPDATKRRAAAHVTVEARNDLVAERVAEAAEYHLAGLAAWLGTDLPPAWDPPCTIRVHASREEFHAATGTGGIAFALSRIRVQGERIVTRSLDVFQTDPWLLSGTLPHELAHHLMSTLAGGAPLPLAVDEALALQAECPARRLMYRRRLDAQPPALDRLLAATDPPPDVEGFYAEAAALGGWLIEAAAAEPAGGGAPARRVLELFRGGVPADWWEQLGWRSRTDADRSWDEWFAARRSPHRMPLMILVEPSPEHRRAGPASRPATRPAER